MKTEGSNRSTRKRSFLPTGLQSKLGPPAPRGLKQNFQFCTCGPHGQKDYIGYQQKTRIPDVLVLNPS